VLWSVVQLDPGSTIWKIGSRIGHSASENTQVVLSITFASSPGSSAVTRFVTYPGAGTEAVVTENDMLTPSPGTSGPAHVMVRDGSS
jgi:hypothetical protein